MTGQRHGAVHADDDLLDLIGGRVVGAGRGDELATLLVALTGAVDTPTARVSRRRARGGRLGRRGVTVLSAVGIAVGGFSVAAAAAEPHHPAPVLSAPSHTRVALAAPPGELLGSAAPLAVGGAGTTAVVGADSGAPSARSPVALVFPSGAPRTPASNRQGGLSTTQAAAPVGARMTPSVSGGQPATGRPAASSSDGATTGVGPTVGAVAPVAPAAPAAQVAPTKEDANPVTTPGAAFASVAATGPAASMKVTNTRDAAQQLILAATRAGAARLAAAAVNVTEKVSQKVAERVVQKVGEKADPSVTKVSRQVEGVPNTKVATTP